MFSCLGSIKWGQNSRPLANKLDIIIDLNLLHIWEFLRSPPFLTSVEDFSTQPHRLFLFQVFYFQEVAYPPQKGRFQGHVEWSGDILKRDASVTLINVPPTFNGTYICQVRNRPDVHGSNGEIMLRVVDKGQAACLGEL